MLIFISPCPGGDCDAGDTIGLAQRAYSALTFNIVPGAAQGSGSVYEDDGLTTAYLNGSVATTLVTYARPDAATLTVTITTTGSFAGMAPTRAYTLRVLNSLPLAAASYTVGTQSVGLPYTRVQTPNAWTYDGQELAAIVAAAPVASGETVTFTLKFIADIDDAFLSGIKGGLQKATLAKRNLDESRSNLGESTAQGGKLMSASSTGDALAYLVRTTRFPWTWLINSHWGFFFSLVWHRPAPTRRSFWRRSATSRRCLPPPWPRSTASRVSRPRGWPTPRPFLPTPLPEH